MKELHLFVCRISGRRTGSHFAWKFSRNDKPAAPVKRRGLFAEDILSLWFLYFTHDLVRKVGQLFRIMR